MTADKQPITEREKRLAALSYLFGFLSGFFVLLFEKQSHYVRFHAMQSLFTFLFLFLVTVVFELIPVVGPIIGAFILLLSGVYGLVLVSKAMQGLYYRVPHIGDVVEKQV